QEAVKEAVVLAREDEPGEKRLVGYVVARDRAATASAAALSAEVLREHLSRVLPQYMVPSAFVALETLPLTTNGKLDRRTLPAPDQSSYSSREYEAPRGEVEEVLAGIWQELLKVERVGRNDNFFELGGHSLLATQLMGRVYANLEVELPLLAIFDAPSLTDLAALAEQIRSSDDYMGVELIPVGGSVSCDT
ncbi:MAG TPA: phosphopantetheine-binding protein, partial [Steroidobacteraceae bacterium]|nr:phosphopantetheine-binding protein [Steroidobacteraceae bacterium]